MTLQVPQIFLRRSFQPTMRWWPFIAFALMLFSCLYRDLPIYSGQIGDDPDNYVRADQVRQLLDHHATLADWFTTRHLRIEPPVGIDAFSRLVDLPILAVAWPLTSIMDTHDAVLSASFIVPILILLPLLFMVAIWAFRPLLGDRWSYVAPLFLVLSPVINNEFIPGRIDHHSWQLILVLAVLGQGLRLLQQDRPRAWHAALMAVFSALSATVGLETLPYLLVMWGALGVRLWLQPVQTARAATIFGLLLPVCGFILLAALRAPAEWSRQTLLVPSMVGVTLQAAIGAGFIISAGAATLLRNLVVRGIAMGMVAAGSITALAWAQPELLRQGAWLGFDPWLIDFTRQNVVEQKKLIAIDALWPVVLSGLLLSLVGYGAAFCKQRASRPAIGLVMSLTVMTGLLSLFYAARIDRYLCLFAIPGLILLLQLGLARLAQSHLAARARYGAELALVMLCLLLPGMWGFTFAADGNVSNLLFLVSKPAKPVCDLSVLSQFLAIAYPQPKTILVSATVGPQLVWDTPHSVIGGGVYDNADSLRAAKRFFATADLREAAGILQASKADLVLVCNGQTKLTSNDVKVEGSTDTNVVDPNSVAVQLLQQKLPDWLVLVDVPLEKQSALYRVDTDKLDAALNQTKP